MNSTSLRQFWSMVEQTQTNVLLELSDRELKIRLQQQWEQNQNVSAPEMKLVQEYIQAKMPLIRDLAEIRWADRSKI